MTTVFIAGSIKIKHLDGKFKERIEKIITSGFDVVVGDADGADTAIQSYLYERGSNNTTVTAADPGQEIMWGIGRLTAYLPIFPPVRARTSPRRMWRWRKRRTTD